MFTLPFVTARVSAWTALEWGSGSRKNNIRPSADYTGPEMQVFMLLDPAQVGGQAITMKGRLCKSLPDVHRSQGPR